MNWWKRRPRQPSPHRIEERLLRGDSIPLRLAPDLVVMVGLDGLSMVVTSAQPMTDEEGRQLLLAARYAVTVPPRPPGAPEPAEDPHSDSEGRTIRVSLPHRENEIVGDTLAAYFRLNEE